MADVMLSIPAKFPKPLIDEVDAFVKEGVFTSRSEFIREAVRRLLESEVCRIHPARVYLALVDRNISGKVAAKTVDDVVEEGRRIREEVFAGDES
ncbi:MAG: ribbon-helix-helix protein, CopG family [Candidatus Altiarchaeota archaeon]